MAIVGKEDTFHSNINKVNSEGDIDPYFLVNNHAYFEDAKSDYRAAINDKYPLIFEDPEQTRKAEENVRYAKEHGLIKNNTPQYSTYILADAFKRFSLNPKGYNLGQKNYIPMWKGIRNELINEKQLQQYWNTRGKQEYMRGQREGISIPLVK